MITINDQLGRSLSFHHTPKRIISLVPSLSELIVDLCDEDIVIGCTKFCIHPKSLKPNSQIIGGTKTVDIDLIKAIDPDLIIANKEENDRDQIETLSNSHSVYITDIQTIDDAINTIRELGIIFDQNERAKQIISLTSKNLPSQIFKQKNVLYLIWRKPWMSIGADTYIHNVLTHLGLENILNTHLRYPELISDEIKKLNPDIIFLSSEPFPFKEKHIHELELLCPKAKVHLVDGEAFSWYGSRLTHIDGYFSQLRYDLEV